MERKKLNRNRCEKGCEEGIKMERFGGGEEVGQEGKRSKKRGKTRKKSADKNLRVKQGKILLR